MLNFLWYILLSNIFTGLLGAFFAYNDDMVEEYVDALCDCSFSKAFLTVFYFAPVIVPIGVVLAIVFGMSKVISDITKDCLDMLGDHASDLSAMTDTWDDTNNRKLSDIEQEQEDLYFVSYEPKDYV